MSRPSNTYRGARRTLARQHKVLWREVPLLRAGDQMKPGVTIWKWQGGPPIPLRFLNLPEPVVRPRIAVTTMPESGMVVAMQA